MTLPYKKLGLALGLLLLVFALVALAAGRWRWGQGALEKADAPAALRAMILGRGVEGTPVFNWMNAEMGERTVNGLPVATGFATPLYDLSNPDLEVAAHDYVLAGRVERCVGTRYPDSLAGRPRTDYDVTVLEVVKGNLEAGQKIPVTKDGGVSEDGQYIRFVYGGDFLLKVRGVYVFIVAVSLDGKELSVMSPFSTVPLEDDIVAELNRIRRRIGSNKQEAISKSLEKSEVFARYVAAAKNKGAEAKLPPEIRNRKRVKSVYEK
ncbi:MAG: hypothetical protein FWE94_04460 [Coriobacteriia bacterium]|nr:hypothetical protein [Coriobacteriia bacterium]